MVQRAALRERSVLIDTHFPNNAGALVELNFEGVLKISKEGSSMHVGVVGAGIVGLAYAWAAAGRGHRVTVLEKSPWASGASIRNFGMVWPIGQPCGASYQTAMRSRQSWLSLSESAGVWVNRCGSIHLAYHDDELAVMREFAAAAGDFGVVCRMQTAHEILSQSPAANPDGLLGGLYSPTELCVNPRVASAQIAKWLANHHGVDFQFSTHVIAADSTTLRTADCRSWEFDRVVVCGGAEAGNLFPLQMRQSGLRLCKLQMLRTVAQPDQWRLGPHIAGGLTLRHYRSFEICPTLAILKARIATEKPELDRYGIHVMASQDDQGHVILGDSHEYDDQIDPFDKESIDEMILRELRTLIRLPAWTIQERWHGIYAKHPETPIYHAEPMPGVYLRTGTGGAGMTMSFGLAEADWETIESAKTLS
jgi:FAD dependent oxidoreductase TIGR03364